MLSITVATLQFVQKVPTVKRSCSRLCVILALCLAAPAWAQRVALLVGNAAYDGVTLRTPVNDAELMQSVLKVSGFDVTVLRNADRITLLDALKQFDLKALGADVALFYFAGVGGWTHGHHHLLPVNAQVTQASDLAEQAVDVDSVLALLEAARPRAAMVVLDTGWDAPFSWLKSARSPGQAKVNVPEGMLLAYSAEPGRQPLEGQGYSLYGEQLAKHLVTQDLELREVFRRTSDAVRDISKGIQAPRTVNRLDTRVVLLSYSKNREPHPACCLPPPPPGPATPSKVPN